MIMAAINQIFERLDGIDTELRTMRADLNGHFTELSRQNTHTAQLVAATAGDITGLAPQLIDHLTHHAA